MRAEGKLNYSRRPVIRQEMTAAVNYARFRTVFANYPQLLDAPRNTRIRKQGNLSNFYYPGNRLFIFPFRFHFKYTIRTIARDFVLTDECVLSLGRFYANFTLSPTHSASNLKLTWKLRVTNDKVFEQYFGNFREL